MYRLSALLKRHYVRKTGCMYCQSFSGTGKWRHHHPCKRDKKCPCYRWRSCRNGSCLRCCKTRTSCCTCRPSGFPWRNRSDRCRSDCKTGSDTADQISGTQTGTGRRKGSFKYGGYTGNNPEGLSRLWGHTLCRCDSGCSSVYDTI